MTSRRAGTGALFLSSAIALVFAAAHARLLAEMALGRRAKPYNDFQHYWEAGRRFLAQPMSLYTESSKVDLLGFLYPPPSVALFVPFALVSHGLALWLFRALVLVALLASLSLLAQILGAAGIVVRPRERALLVLIALAAGPTYSNTLYGQVNTLVLLSCLGSRWLLERGRPFRAGAVLAAGVWLKVYPLVCLVWVIAWERRAHDVRRVFAGFVAGAVLILLLAAPFVPVSLYRVYFSELLPRIAGRTSTYVLNQSLLGALARAGGSPGYYLDMSNCLLPVVPSLGARLANAAFAGGGFLGLGLWSRSRGPVRRAVAYLCLLSLIPMISPLGWSYVYVLALPALLVGLLLAPPRALATCVVLVGACLAYFVSEHRSLGFAAWLPEPLQHLFYSRYPVAAALVSAVLMRGATGRPPQGTAHAMPSEVQGS